MGDVIKGSRHSDGQNSRYLVGYNTSPKPVTEGMPSMSLIWAIAANADYFITGDQDFAPSPTVDNTQIISVSQFLQLVEANGEDEA